MILRPCPLFFTVILNDSAWKLAPHVLKIFWGVFETEMLSLYPEIAKYIRVVVVLGCIY